MLSNDFRYELHTTISGSSVQKAKHYSEHVEKLLAEIAALEAKIETFDVDTEMLAKLRNLTGVDPTHLARLLDLEKAIGSVGYGLPPMATAG